MGFMTFESPIETPSPKSIQGGWPLSFARVTCSAVKMAVQEGTRDKGENDEQAHQHEEILESREGSEEARSNSRNGSDGGFRWFVPFLRWLRPCRGGFSLFSNPMHYVDGVIDANTEHDGSNHGREDVDIDITALH